MFRKIPDETQVALDRTIIQLLADMQTMDGSDEAYASAKKQLKELYELKEKHSRKRVNPDTWLIVGGNLAGIFIIVAYEHGHVIASKAINQIGKLR